MLAPTNNEMSNARKAWLNEARELEVLKRSHFNLSVGQGYGDDNAILEAKHEIETNVLLQLK